MPGVITLNFLLKNLVSSFIIDRELSWKFKLFSDLRLNWYSNYFLQHINLFQITQHVVGLFTKVNISTSNSIWIATHNERQVVENIELKVVDYSQKPISFILIGNLMLHNLWWFQWIQLAFRSKIKHATGQ